MVPTTHLDFSNLSMVPDLIPIHPNAHHIRSSSPIQEHIHKVSSLPVLSRPSTRHSSASRRDYGNERDIQRTFDELEKRLQYMGKAFTTVPSPSPSGSSSSSAKDLESAIRSYSRLVHRAEKLGRPTRSSEREDRLAFVVDESHFEITTGSGSDSSSSTPTPSLIEMNRAASSDRLPPRAPSHQSSTVSLGGRRAAQRSSPVRKERVDQGVQTNGNGKSKSLHFLDQIEIQNVDRLPREMSPQSHSVGSRSPSETFTVPFPRFALPDYARDERRREGERQQRRRTLEREEERDEQLRRHSDEERSREHHRRREVERQMEDEERSWDRRREVERVRNGERHETGREVESMMNVERRETGRDLFAPVMDVDSIKGKRHYPEITKRTLGGGGVRARFSVPLPQRPRGERARSAERVRRKSPQKKAVPFFSSSHGSQSSYSLYANTQEVLALLRQFFPSLHSLKREILVTGSNNRPDVAIRFAAAVKVLMDELDDKYQMDLRSYESATDINEQVRLDREMDKAEKMFDALTKVHSKLSQSTAPIRPLTKHSEHGGTVHQLKMIHQALAEAFGIM